VRGKVATSSGRAGGASLQIISLATITLLADVVAAEQCYQDASGRIVKRRRPGFVEVPCPKGPPTQPGTAPQRPPPAAQGATTPPSAESPAAPRPKRRRVRRVRRVRRRPPPPRPRQLPADEAPAPTITDIPPPAPTTSDVPPPARPISRIPRPMLNDYVDAVPVPDRWRIVETLGLREHVWDPYNRNVLKGDRPVHGDWFVNLGLVSDTVFELREVPTPVGGATSQDPGAVDTFGRDDQGALVENLATELVYYKGDTVFRPPDFELRFTPVFNYTGVRLQELGSLNADPQADRTRHTYFLGMQAAFVDLHLRNASKRYDFDSSRVGIQPFSADFRGFLFQDNQLGVRLFGTRSNNSLQYNIAYFRRLEKDTNSGLNDVLVKPRHDEVVPLNLYFQDWPALGFTSQATVVYNRNREGGDEAYYDDNGFIQRPASLGREQARDYDVVYFGYNGDGHFGALNLTTSFYYAIGRETPGTFVPAKTRISAVLAALEASVDFDWMRWRLSGLYGSGDEDPFDDRATGFDAIFENPQFAGADSSYWIRQAVPLIGGGKVALSGRNGVLANLRSSKDEGQSNFTNPGVLLAGLGPDFDLLPTLRLSGNANTLYFHETAVLEVARNQGEIPRHIGYDLSASLIWRPLMSQNIVFRASYATLLAGAGWKALYAEEFSQYFLVNAILAY